MRIAICLLLTFVVNCSSHDDGLMRSVKDLGKENAIDYSGQDISPNDIIWSNERDSSAEDLAEQVNKPSTSKLKNKCNLNSEDCKYRKNIENTKETKTTQVTAPKDIITPKSGKTKVIKFTDDNSGESDDEDDYDSSSEDEDDEEDKSPKKRPSKTKQHKKQRISSNATHKKHTTSKYDTKVLHRQNINWNMTNIGALVPQNLSSCQKNFKNHYSDEDPASTTLLNYPFVVSIQRRGSHYATGALLDKKWVLSVAGEFYNVRETLKLFRARLGSVDNKRGGLLIPLKRIVIHPDFVRGKPNFDLAMLMLGSPVQYCDYIKPISISKFTSKVIGGRFLTTYWPRLILNGEPLPSTASERTRQNSLRVSTQKLIPPDKCNKQMELNITLDVSTLCLKPFVSHHSICVPDAGAPVVGEDGIWGITSGWVSPECQKNPSPYVFSRLSSMAVRSWLAAQLSEK